MYFYLIISNNIFYLKLLKSFKLFFLFILINVLVIIYEWNYQKYFKKYFDFKSIDISKNWNLKIWRIQIIAKYIMNTYLLKKKLIFIFIYN